MSIRPATIDDAEAITRMHTRAWQAAYRGILPDAIIDGLATDLPERIERRRRWFEGDMGTEHRHWALEADGVLTGWAATGPCRDADLEALSHELYAIYLEPDAIGKGHGRTLMTHCIDDVRGRGFAEMVMWVLAGNARAQAFYRAAGFAPDPRVEPAGFLETGATKLRMRRSLDPGQ